MSHLKPIMYFTDLKQITPTRNELLPPHAYVYMYFKHTPNTAAEVNICAYNRVCFTHPLLWDSQEPQGESYRPHA